MSGAIDVAVPSAPPPAGPGEAARGLDAGTRGDAVGRETECSHVHAFFASREGRDTLAPLARCCVDRAEIPPAAVLACLDCAALCTRAEARAHAVGTGGADRGEDLEPNPNRVDRECRGVFVDVRVAELYCAPCDARAYHRDFDRAVLGARAVSVMTQRDPERESTEKTGLVVDDDESARVAKRWRGEPARARTNDASAAEPEAPSVVSTDVDVRSHEPVGDAVGDAELVAARAADLARVDARGVPRGVRGVANLGNTCFMSTVLHATLRSPTVGGFFLRDGHARELCRARAKGSEPFEPFAGGASEPASRPCLACELDGLTSALYGGDSKPVVPATFLHSWWRQAPEHLRGQGQHDAHEFFLGLVSAAHADLVAGARGGAGAGDAPARGGRRDETDETGKKHDDSDSRCPCPMHRAFAGTLRSDVTCGACGHVSTVTDPTVGLSLDVPATPAGAVTLEECLRRFVRPERLCDADAGSSSGAFACARCGDRAAAKTKQMSLSRAPPTLALHLKRFRRGAKIDRHVAFPFALDVAPYASSAAERARVAFGDRARNDRLRAAPDADEDEPSARTAKPRETAATRERRNVRSAYELFAVVVHSGGMESGHYVCYVKCQNAWFRCDDHMVSRADPVVVAAAQAYLLFYHAV